MSEVKHTPGPWKTEKGYWYEAHFIVDISGPNQDAIAEVKACGLSSRESVSVIQANARLVAEAPAMYEFLKALMLDTWNFPLGTCEAREAILASIEGRDGAAA